VVEPFLGHGFHGKSTDFLSFFVKLRPFCATPALAPGANVGIQNGSPKSRPCARKNWQRELQNLPTLLKSREIFDSVPENRQGTQ
jgi:hypothetical protein